MEGRNDVLCFTTPPLENDLEVTGPVTLTLYVSSAPDTDFTGKLVDVFPDGRAMILTKGSCERATAPRSSTPHRSSPRSLHRLTIDLWSTANVFKTGHKIRLEVSDSNFPRFDRNSNTGGTIAEEPETEFVVAENTIYHDAEHPSHLTLPLIGR